MDKIKMNLRNSIFIWSFVLIILSCNMDVEAAKAARPRGNKGKTPNHSHVALSYPSSHASRGHSNNHHPVQQQKVHQTHNQAPSAPALPTNNHNTNSKPIGWDVSHSNAPAQQHTVPNTHSAPAYPQNPPPYHPTSNVHTPAGPPPPYNPNPAFNSHYPAGPPPPYSQNPQPGLNSHVPAGQPAASYPVHNAPNAAYPQQQHYNPNPAGSYPGNAQGFNPGGQPVINNFYGQPQAPQVPQSGGSGGSFLQTALAAGAGSLAGNALYGALKPHEETKTIIIHENNNQPATSSAAPPPPPPPAPAASGETVTTTTVAVPPPSSGGYPNVQQPSTDTQPRVGAGTENVPPLAPYVPLAPLPDQTSNVPLSPSFETATIVANQNATQVSSTAHIETVMSSTSVPLASFPIETSTQAHLKSSASTFRMFNLSIYTIISVLITKFL